MNGAARPRLVALAVLCVAVPALIAGGTAHAETPDPRPSVHRSSSGVLTYDDPRYDGRRTTAVKGKVETVIKESFRDHHSEEFQSINTDAGDVIPVSTRGGTALPTGGRFVGKVVMTDSATQPVATATVTPATVAAAPVPAVHKAYVAVVGTSQPTMTESQAAALVDQITGYWVDQSKTAGGTIISDFPTEDIEIFALDSAATCLSDHNTLWNDVDDKFLGVDFDGSPNHLIVILPGCASGGLGTVGTSLASGGMSIVAIANGAADQIGVHELGHNVGLGHANLEYCNDAGTTPCPVEEYGNAYSVMAAGFTGLANPNLPSLDSVFRQALGLTTSTELRPVTLPFGAPEAVTTPVHLAPRADSAGARGVEVTDPETGDKILVEHRSGTGRDANVVYTRQPSYSESLPDGSTAPFKSGVVISRVTDVGVNTGPVNLLMTERVGSLRQTSFGAGDRYVSPNGNVTVNVTAASGTAGADIAVTLDAPYVASSKPTIVGTVKVGNTVRANSGTWETGSTLSYQWLSNGSAIAGATLEIYRPPTYGRTLSVQVTGSKAGRLTVRQTSAGSFVARGTFSTVQPTISGTARVGRTLKAYHGTWKPPPSSWSYQWYADGRTITGATRSYYVITKSRVGQRIKVKVTGKRAGYVITSRTSASTAVVRR